jgi:hypothetical protein
MGEAILSAQQAVAYGSTIAPAKTRNTEKTLKLEAKD